MKYALMMFYEDPYFYAVTNAEAGKAVAEILHCEFMGVSDGYVPELLATKTVLETIEKLKTHRSYLLDREEYWSKYQSPEMIAGINSMYESASFVWDKDAQLRSAAVCGNRDLFDKLYTEIATDYEKRNKRINEVIGMLS